MTRATLERTTLGRDAYGAIREMLVDEARFAAGEKISIEALSRDLGISRSPVWAAVSRLEAEGLLQVVPRQGVFVIAFDRARIVAIFEAREALEGMAARLAAQRMTPDDHAALDEALTRQANAIDRRDGDAYRIANLDFHHGLLATARNTTIETSLRALYAQVQTMCSGGASSMDDWARLGGNVAEHRQVFDMIAKGDAEGAERAAREHVRQLLETILARAGGEEAEA
ncbi:GntR family transcriptional regulator [Burkholderia lata]|uniref:GntR family transcriptional regulator n=1 Tax=Burkholderia lata (strain ATCC 17760 / DSM 23089 / LMG 22485 / NCIMB 9086 / R18194 / 383) TaxID=482957 RepID=UPI001453BD20|nr:GntR family transcriptional regulator [Burkholderia lata]VWD47605.1 GntR family transcriptional regulator [Burkholderia lata]